MSENTRPMTTEELIAALVEAKESVSDLRASATILAEERDALQLQVKMQSKPMCDELELLAERDNWKTKYSNAMDVNTELRAENDKLSDLWSKMRDERNALRNADVDREKYCKRLEADAAKFEPFLKEDETPFQRLEREIKDGRALMTVYGHALAEKAELESQMQGLSNEINDFQNTIERQKRERDALRAEVERRYGIGGELIAARAERDALRAEVGRLKAAIRAHVESSNNDDSAGDTFADLVAIVGEQP